MIASASAELCPLGRHTVPPPPRAGPWCEPRRFPSPAELPSALSAENKAQKPGSSWRCGAQHARSVCRRRERMCPLGQWQVWDRPRPFKWLAPPWHMSVCSMESHGAKQEQCWAQPRQLPEVPYWIQQLRPWSLTALRHNTGESAHCLSLAGGVSSWGGSCGLEQQQNPVLCKTEGAQLSVPVPSRGTESHGPSPTRGCALGDQLGHLPRKASPVQGKAVCLGYFGLLKELWTEVHGPSVACLTSPGPWQPRLSASPHSPTPIQTFTSQDVLCTEENRPVRAMRRHADPRESCDPD
ncbi:uncharacterized protein [Callorhinus ursinus]|uniref:uncharacterized protein n=1 Tax=Callorhinus ursinus TaxID=34884 RepID=UPI003CD03C5F